jgi:hypothetical protein
MAIRLCLKRCQRTSRKKADIEPSKYDVTIGHASTAHPEITSTHLNLFDQSRLSTEAGASIGQGCFLKDKVSSHDSLSTL